MTLVAKGRLASVSAVSVVAGAVARCLWSRQALWTFSVLLIGYSVIGSVLLYAGPATDYWEHLAAMQSFARNPFHPSNPYILSSQPTHLFTPYHLFWGCVARLTGISVFWLSPLIAACNSALLLFAIRRFCSRIIGDAKYALALILTMFFLWIDPWTWSGFYNFGLWPLTAIYPYWPAFALSLLVISEYGESRSTSSALFYGVVAACVFLIHPITGSFLLLSLGLRLALLRSASLFTRIRLLAGVCVLTLVGALAWPYFPVVKAVLDAPDFTRIGFAGDWHRFYEHLEVRLLPALPGLCYVAYSLFRRRFDFVCAGVLATTAIYLFNYVFLQNPTFARYIIFVVFFCHVGLIVALRHAEEWPSADHFAALLVVALALTSPLQMGSSLVKLAPVRDVVFGDAAPVERASAVVHRLAALKGIVGPADVVMAPLDYSWEIPAVVDCKVVGVEHSNPFIADYFERRAATEQFFSRAATRDQRLKTLAGYEVSYVLVPRKDEDALRESTSNWPVVLDADGFRLYAVK